MRARPKASVYSTTKACFCERLTFNSQTSTSRRWSNISITSSHQSPRPLPKRLANPDLSPDTKVKRCEKTNVMFNKVYTWTQLNNVLCLVREVGAFCRAINDAQSADKKVILTNNAKAYRSKANNIRHDGVCVFVHFLPEFKQCIN